MHVQNSLRHIAATTKQDALVKKFNDDTLPSILPILKCILLDGYNLLKNYGFTDYTRDLVSLEKRFNNQGVGFIQKSLPNLFNNLLRYLETGVSLYPEFALQKGTKHPRFLRRLFEVIYDCDSSDKDQALAMQIMYQLTAAFKKLEGPYSTKVLRDSLADFVSVDEDLAKCNITTGAAGIIMKHAQAVITQLFSSYDPDDGQMERPSPGSGATATALEKNLRFRPRVLYEQLDDVYDHDVWFNTAYQYLFGGTAVDYGTALRSDSKVTQFPRSRFKYINKKLGTPRGICIEENETQCFQQGLRKPIYAFVEASPRTSGKVNFTDQSVNRDLALESSRTRSKATIDMKEASDRVWREVVFTLFLYTPILDKLSAVSTRMIELPDGLGQRKYMFANKYAPMGSGVCFPVMSLTHWALIQGIIASSQMPDSSRLCREVYVYGDDIIVPSQCAELVYKYLPLFGMKINEEKSYVNSYFRESCGCHAYKGYDITPAFIKKIISRSTKSSDSCTLMSLISKEHRLKSNMFVETAKYLRTSCHKLYGDLPNVNHGSPLVGWKSDHHVTKAQLMPYCKGVKTEKDDSQQLLYKFRLHKVASEELPCLEDDRAYFRKSTMITEESRFISGDPKDARVYWGWVPEPCLADDRRKIAQFITRRTEESVPTSRLRILINHSKGVITLPYSSV